MISIGLSQSMCVALLLLSPLSSWPAQKTAEAPDQSPTVGEPQVIEGLFLPGTLLQPRPLTDDRQPIVLRITNAFAQGTLGYRYDLNFAGYEPGNFDLREYLERVDGSSAADLPPIPVQIRSLLPPGQVQPNALSGKTVPRFGGYRWWMSLAVIFWLWVFAALLLLGWRKKQTAAQASVEVTLADLLRPRIQAARDNQLDARQCAELERMLIAMWQRKLKLTEAEPTVLVNQIRRHPESGPLMRQLERWMHDPSRDEAIDLAKLLEPLSRLSARDFQATMADAAKSSEPSQHSGERSK